MISTHKIRKQCSKCRQCMDSSLSLCPFCASEQGEFSFSPATKPLPWNHEWESDSPALIEEQIAASESLANKQRIKRIFGSLKGLNTLIFLIAIFSPFVYLLSLHKQIELSSVFWAFLCAIAVLILPALFYILLVVTKSLTQPKELRRLLWDICLLNIALVILGILGTLEDLWTLVGSLALRKNLR